MAKELNKETKTQVAEEEVKVTEADLDEFEISEEELEDISGGRAPAFVRADYPGFFAKYH
jgi:hypothetical protein